MLTDADILRHLLEDAKEISAAQLARDTKIQVSYVLSGKRKLTRSHIEILSKYFRVSPAVFFHYEGSNGHTPQRKKL